MDLIKMSLGLFLSAVTYGGFLLAASESGSVRFVPGKDSFNGSISISDLSHVEIRGFLGASAPKELALALERALEETESTTLSGDRVVDVHLDSPGGSVPAAIAMGKLLRQYAAVVYVNRGAICASSCIFVLAGGVERNVMNGGQLIIHRPYFEPDQFGKMNYSESQERYAVLTQVVSNYLVEMGMDERLFNELMRVPSNDGVIISREYAETLRLIGKDPAYEEWVRARIKLHRGPEYLERLDRYTDCARNGGTSDECNPLFPRNPE